MRIRRATEADERVLRELWQEFELEVPEPDGFDAETWEDDWRDTREDLGSGSVFIAEDDEGPVGVVRGHTPKQGAVHVELVHVRPRARRRGVAKELLRHVAADARERGARTISLDVLASNADARAVWRRLGFDELSVFMATPLEALERRLSAPTGESRGTVYVQTDDEGRVRDTVARYLPRLGRPEGTEVSATGTGWVAVSEPILDREPRLLRRLAQELSLSTGAVSVSLGVELGAAVRYAIFDRGGNVDEYLSLPELYGPLPPGDVVALGANPRVVSRLTGADPSRVRQVARTAAAADQLPPAAELRDALARVLGLE